MSMPPSPSAKRKGKCLHARIEELDLERAVLHVPLLTNQLVEPIFRDRAMALAVYVHTAILKRRRAVDRDAKPDRPAAGSRTEHEMQIAGMKTEHNPPRRRRRYRVLAGDGPLAAQAPLIHLQVAGRRIALRAVLGDRLRRGVVLLPFVAHVGFR